MTLPAPAATKLGYVAAITWERFQNFRPYAAQVSHLPVFTQKDRFGCHPLSTVVTASRCLDRLIRLRPRYPSIKFWLDFVPVSP